MKAFVAAALLLLAVRTWGHHSYAMFDGSREVSVEGVVASFEWANPHVFIWVHVPNARASSGYDLYAFSGASTNLLARNGWSAGTLKVGERITVDYWPLKDGRTGGHLIKVTHADGRVTRGVSGPNGANPSREATREP